MPVSSLMISDIHLKLNNNNKKKHTGKIITILLQQKWLKDFD